MYSNKMFSSISLINVIKFMFAVKQIYSNIRSTEPPRRAPAPARGRRGGGGGGAGWGRGGGGGGWGGGGG